MAGHGAPGHRLPWNERGAAILEAVGPLVAERAVDAISMSDVVRVAGVSRPIVYRHFATTRDLVIALIERHRDALLKTLDDHVAQAGRVGDEQALGDLLAAMFALFASDPAGWRLLAQEPSSDARVAEVQRRAREEIDAALARALSLPRRGRARIVTAEAVRATINAVYACTLDHPAAWHDAPDHAAALLWGGIGDTTGR